jgi:SAM-dependent methyltransferase
MKIWDVDAQNSIRFLIRHYPDFQLQAALTSGPPILNAACAGDIAGLGMYGAINLDIRSAEHLRRIGLRVPRNYREGSVFKLPFEDKSFRTVVLGEFLEHCTVEAATKAVKECARVLCSGGKLIITVPLDGRPNGHNRPGYSEGSDDLDRVGMTDEMMEKEAGEWSEGVTAYHQTWWSNEMLHNLRESSGLKEEYRSAILYSFTAPIGGWGISWEKP